MNGYWAYLDSKTDFRTVAKFFLDHGYLGNRCNHDLHNGMVCCFDRNKRNHRNISWAVGSTRFEPWRLLKKDKLRVSKTKSSEWVACRFFSINHQKTWAYGWPKKIILFCACDEKVRIWQYLFQLQCRSSASFYALENGSGRWNAKVHATLNIVSNRVFRNCVWKQSDAFNPGNS